jgi:hypothetical protein
MIKIEDKRWCVYTHATDGEVFYVGVGISTRPFERIKRNHLWSAHVAANPTLEVGIALWTNDRNEALRLEAKMIRDLVPRCNQLMNGYTNAKRNRKAATVHSGKSVSSGTRQKISAARTGVIPNGWTGRKHRDETKDKIRAAHKCHPIVCVETGEQFQSIRSASIELGIAKTSLRAHLRGDAPHVRGMTFLRVGLDTLVAGTPYCVTGAVTVV